MALMRNYYLSNSTMRWTATLVWASNLAAQGLTIALTRSRLCRFSAPKKLSIISNLLGRPSAVSRSA
eukprot:3428403-Pleurochrysis_carterae.AAC.1